MFTSQGVLNIKNAKYEFDDTPLDPNCDCPSCQKYSKAYIRHLYKAGEMLAMRLCVLHNLYFYNKLMADIRTAIDNDNFSEFKAEKCQIYDKRI